MTMQRKTIIKAALLLSPTIITLLLLSAYWLSKGELQSEAERETPVRSLVSTEVKDGVTVLTVDLKSQEHSGIRAQKLALAAGVGAGVYGIVQDVQALVELSGRCASAGADRRAAQAELYTLHAEFLRLQKLNADGNNVSLKAVEAAQSAETSAQAKVILAQATLDSSTALLHHQYGNKLGEIAIRSGATGLAPFVQGRETLLRMTLGNQGVSAPVSVLIDHENHPVIAQLVSSLPQVDAVTQTQAYLYRTAGRLPSGMRVTGRLPGGKKDGVIVPASAVVWYGGQPWVYKKNDVTHFERIALKDAIPSGEGYFVMENFGVSELVVTRGAQLLLSEEGRSLLSSKE